MSSKKPLVMSRVRKRTAVRVKLAQKIVIHRLGVIALNDLDRPSVTLRLPTTHAPQDMLMMGAEPLVMTRVCRRNAISVKLAQKIVTLRHGTSSFDTNISRLVASEGGEGQTLIRRIATSKKFFLAA